MKSDKLESGQVLGKGTIAAGEREVHIWMSYKAIGRAEQAMGKGMIAVANSFAEGTSGVSEIACLLQAGMEEARRAEKHPRGRTVTLDDAYEVLNSAGFSRVTDVLMNAVAEVLGHDPAGGKEE